jgi:Hemerythrin HHE cation binding domain
MTEEKTLNPVIHAAFRRDLRRFDQALGAFEDGDGDRAGQLTAAWDRLSYQLHRHHQDEESFFWPAFDELGVDMKIIESLQGEHDKMVSALEVADGAMADYGPDPTAENARAARLAIDELNRVLCDHLAHEERELDPFSIATQHTKQHKAAERAARKAHTEGAGCFFAWLTDGCDAESGRIIRRQVPAPVLWLLTRTGRQYNRSIAPIWS